MVVQYGYIALFSPCFPLAPVFAAINNVTEIRGDSWKLCKGYQRPSANSAEDIGSWFTVLNIVGFLAVMTNATMICFVGSQLAVEEKGELAGIGARIDSSHLWQKGVMIEHGVMVLRIIIMVFFPLYPAWLGEANEVLKFRVSEIKKSAKLRRAQEDAKDYGDELLDLESDGVLSAERFFKSDANKDKRLSKTVRLRGHVVATFFVAAGGRPSRLTDNHRARRNLLMSSVTLVSSLRTLIQTTMV